MAARPTKSPGFPDVAEAIAEIRKAGAGGRGRRSPLYLWLRTNHDQLAREFDRAGTAWDPLATFLGKQGVLDGRGQKPTGRGVRAVWFRVRAELKASGRPSGEAAIPGVHLAPEQAETTALSSPATDQAKPIRSQGKADVETGGSKPLVEAEEPAPVEFGFARIRHAQATPSRRNPVSAPPPRRDPDEVIARKISQRKPGAIPMPTPIEPEDE